MQTPFSFPSPVIFVHLKAAHSFLVVLCLGWAKGLRHNRLIALLGWPLLPRENSASPKFRGLEVLSLWYSLRSSTHKGTMRVTQATLRYSASVELQGKEVLSLQDALHCNTHPSIRWRHCKFYTLRMTPYRRTYESQFFFGSWVKHFGRDTFLHFKTPTWMSTRRSMSKGGTGMD